MLLSIIIPIYNVEAFLHQCIESCICQNLPENLYEIITVNDGSSDNSFDIIKEYEKKVNNIIVINKKNGGLSSARNAGLRTAKGKYVWFVDSDDWIKDFILHDIVKQTEQDPDLIVLNTIIYDHKKETKVPRPFSQKSSYCGVEIYNGSWFYPYSGVQFYIFKKAFLLSRNIFFKEGIVFEDLLFTSQVLSIAKTCVSFEEPVYFYRIRENSITSSGISEKKLNDMFSVMDEQYVWFQSVEDCNKQLMSDAICKTANIIIRNYYLKMNRQGKKNLKHMLNNKKYWKYCVFSSKNIKNYFYFFGFKFRVLFL